MLKRIDHIGVIVDNLGEAKQFLNDLGMEFDRDHEFPGRLTAAFYHCGSEVQVEVIEIIEPDERKRRLGKDKARIEHIAVVVDNLATTLRALEALGVRVNTTKPVAVGSNLNLWTIPDTCDGVMYQLIEKGPK